MSLNPSIIYPPLRSPTETRLLRIVPSQNEKDDTIRCFLSVIDVNGDPERPGKDQSTSNTPNFHKYIALSYVWGDQSRLRSIYVDNQTFLVGENLLNALKALSQASFNLDVAFHQDDVDGNRSMVEVSNQYFLPPKKRYVWIDAICINQADVSEREAQVKLMSRIYSRAELVHVELGYGRNQDNTEFVKLLQKLKLIATSSLHRKDISEPGLFNRSVVNLSGSYALETYGIPPFNDPVWKNFQAIVTSTYFTRIWIMQEYLLAQHVLFALGSSLLDPTLFSLGYFMITDKSQGGLRYIYPENVGPHSRAIATHDLFTHLYFRRIVKEETKITTSIGVFNLTQRLIDNLSYLRGANATDQRDFFFAQLGISSDAGQFSHLVTYSEPAKSVFTAFASRFIELGQGINMLYSVDSGPPWSNDLPRWLPNWARSPVEPSLLNRRFRTPLYAASLKVPSSIFVKGSRLYVNGGIFDRVSHVNESLPFSICAWNTGDIARFLREGMQVLQHVRCFPGGQRAADILARTITCDEWGPDKQNGLGENTKPFYDVVSRLFSKVPEEIATLHRDIIAIYKYFHLAIGRALCITENGYLGLVPGATRVGDQICLFYGGVVPFVIRPSATEGCFLLLGQGYMHGLMDGEIFDLRSFKPQQIILD